MSMETWIDEFYPEPASEATPEYAVEMSLQKWRGLREEPLARHGLRRFMVTDSSNLIVEVDGDHETFVIDGDSCSLCYLYEAKGLEGTHCATCPLFLVRGGVRCDNVGAGETESPYTAFLSRGDPEPMIAWLEEAAKLPIPTHLHANDNCPGPDDCSCACWWCSLGDHT